MNAPFKDLLRAWWMAGGLFLLQTIFLLLWPLMIVVRWLKRLG